ncbi:MAG: hypothetical protein QGH59_02920, partial [Gemmatimonadota bacterium]|nr:hypothetical protein [Gemmatimonadota bacterium]
MTRHNPTPDPALLQDSVEGLLGAPESERLRRLVESDEGWAAASRREEAFLRFLGTPLDEPLPAGLHDAILAAARRTPPRRAFLPRLSPVLEYALAFGGAAAVLALVLAGRSAVPAAVPEAFATGAVLLARGVTVLKAALFASSSAFSEAGRL